MKTTWTIIITALNLLLLPAMATAQGSLDAALVAVPGKNKTTVRVLSANGAQGAALTLTATKDAEFLEGNWDGSGNAPAVVRKQGQNLQIQMYNRAGVALGTSTLSTQVKNLAALLVGAVGGATNDDLIEVRLDGTVLVHLDPVGGAGAQLITQVVSGDSYGLVANRSGAVGIAALDNDSNTLHITGFYQSLTPTIPLQVVVKGRLLAVAIAELELSFAVVNDDAIHVFAANGTRVEKIELSDNEQVISGDLLSTAGGFGQLIWGLAAGHMQILDLANDQNMEATFSITDTVLPQEVDPCAAITTEIEQQLAKLTEALIKGQFFKVSKITKKLTALEKKKSKCQGNAGGGAEIDAFAAAKAARFIPSALAIDGGAALACDQFFIAKDGGKQGFLMKNGDSTGKIVVLLPSGGLPYTTVQILNSSYKVIETLKYAGLGNPDPNFALRTHWRGVKSMANYPKTLVVRAAIGSESGCWIVKRGNANRVD